MAHTADHRRSTTVQALGPRDPIEASRSQQQTPSVRGSGTDRLGSPAHGSTDRVARDEDPLVEPFDHHEGRSSAATIFYPADVDDPEKQSKYNRLKKRNDGTRDNDRAEWERAAEKPVWCDSYGTQLSLPRCVIGEAKRLLDHLDISSLGHYNSLHTAVLACLTLAYRRHWIRTQYRRRKDPTDAPDRQRWCEREDFRRLWESLGLSEEGLRDVMTLVEKKTEV